MREGRKQRRRRRRRRLLLENAQNGFVTSTSTPTPPGAEFNEKVFAEKREKGSRLVTEIGVWIVVNTLRTLYQGQIQ